MKFKRKKNIRQRGSKTHGWGAKKKHRGAGHRGGRGMAATGKRADSLKPSVQEERYFGKYGFVSKSRKKINTINIEDLQKKLKKYVMKGLIHVKNDAYVVDLKDLGYNKLLGKGKVSFKFEITTDYASENVIEKIKKTNGKVTVLKERKNKKEKKEKGTAKKDEEFEEDEFVDAEDLKSEELDKASE